MPGPTDAVVQVEACALNHQDIDIREGTFRLPISLPHITGTEAIGRIRHLPADRQGTPLELGQRVMVHQVHVCGRCTFCSRGQDNLCRNWRMMGVHRPGGYAEFVTAPVDDLLPIGDDLEPTQWAGIQIAFGTAWHLVVGMAGVRPGEMVLVNAAGSGVSSAALQIAKLSGAWVIASAGSDAKLERALNLGADATVNYNAESLYDGVMRLTEGSGVDVAIEHVGGNLFLDALRAVRDGGRLVTCGAHAGEVVSLDLIDIFRSQKRVIGSRMWTRAEIQTVISLVKARRLRPVIDTVFPLKDAAKAQIRLVDRANFGKIVMVP